IESRSCQFSPPDRVDGIPGPPSGLSLRKGTLMQIRFIPYTSAAWPGPAAMKTLLKRLSQAAGVIATTTLIAVLLGACTPGGDTSAGGAAPVELGNYENAIKVSPTLDEGRAATQVIGFDGGTISATAADGTVFTLTIPADSVRQR